jgi:hypothetical protein
MRGWIFGLGLSLIWGWISGLGQENLILGKGG